MHSSDTIRQPISQDTLNSTSGLIATHNITKSNNNEKSIETIRTTCPYCGVGCGVLATITTEDDGTRGKISVQGDPDHPANFGKLCSKGSALAQTLDIERRLTQPYYQNKTEAMRAAFNPALSTDKSKNSNINRKIKTNYTQTPVTLTDWDTVLQDISGKLTDTISKHGRDSVMFYVSGQLLTEDYYVANKLIKGFIGNNNIDSNSRLCMSTAVAGHKRAFGADIVTGSYTDFEDCDLLVLVGSNMAWCHPILFGRFLKIKQAHPNKKLVVIDPRRTASCEFADLHLPIAPGSDTHLYNGLLTYLNSNDYRDDAYVEKCEGIDEALKTAKQWSIDKVAKATGVQASDIEQFYKLVAANDKTVTAFSMGVNQSSSGTDKVNAIINTHLLTGRVGKKGANPFSLTGQPNAMGGREVGALSNLLAAHLELDNSQHRDMVANFWQAPQPISPNVGIKACEVTDAILDGRIKAIWIMATNPVVSLPEADKFRKALEHCDLVIVSECSVDSDTIRCADIVLPAQGWGEKSGTVTNSERRISRQRQLLPAAGEAKPDWWIMSQVAKRMGFDGFDYQNPSDIFKEHVQLTDLQNGSEASSPNQFRYLNLAHDIKNLTLPNVDTNATSYSAEDTLLSLAQYDALEPFQWGGSHINVINSKRSSGDSVLDKTENSVKNITTHTAKFVSIVPPENIDAITMGINSTCGNGTEIQSTIKQTNLAISGLDLRLITGRLRDQWHTMTRTGLAATLNQQQSVPTIAINPIDAERLRLLDKDIVQLTPKMVENTRHANIKQKVVAQVDITSDMREGDAFMPMHWSDNFASLARVGTLIPTCVDPISSQPALKNSAVRVRSINRYAVGQILVHPNWQDTVVAKLRTIIDDFNKFEPENASKSDFASAPALVWSISRQENSTLITLSVLSEETNIRLSTQEFWQQFIEGVFKKISNIEIDTSMVISSVKRRLNLVVRGGYDDNAVSDVSVSSIEPKAVRPLIMALYLAPNNEALPSTHWLDSCFDPVNMAEVPSVKWLLAGRPASGYVDPGPLVCSCMSVGENKIIEVIKDNQCLDAKAVGQYCGAGTNCGSCVGQINELIVEYA